MQKLTPKPLTARLPGPRTILICCNAYPPNFIGGAELVAHQQAKALQRLGHSVIVFAGSSLPIRARHSIREESYDGLKVFRVHLEAKDFQPEYVNFFHPKVEEHFDKLMDRFSPDVVHMHNLIGLSAGIVSRACRRGVKTVLTVHDYWVFCFKNTRIFADGSICEDFSRCEVCMAYVNDGSFRGIPIRMRNDFVMLQARQADCIVSPSQFVADAYVHAGMPRSHMRVLWNGVDVERFQSVRKTPPDGRLRFTYVGLLGLHKGVHLIADALQQLCSERRLVTINFVGEGDLRHTLERQIAEWGLQTSVNFWGMVENSRIGEVLAETDVLILPSLWPENQPVSITEAMAAHTPVIASRVGGIPELVQDGVSGYLFEPGNAVGLAQAMACFIDKPERVRSMGEAGYSTIRDVTFDNQVGKLVRIYDE